MRTNDRRSRIRNLRIGAAAAMAAALALPAIAGGHATVSPAQPQTTPLTAARTTYVLRVPNEKATSQSTYKVRLLVPAAVQEAISVKQVADWRVRLARKDTGKKSEEGDKIYAITSITWVAKRGSAIKPAFFGEFFFRFQNPVQPQTLCFPTYQYYRPAGYAKLGRKAKRRAKPEVVAWTGAPDSEFPASCVTTVAVLPAT
jgi:uncharacterized protein YcnI